MVTVTLEEVAKKAGVSKKTVSRVLNNEPSVATKTFQKVQQAMFDLDYVPNTFARRLSSGRAMNIGIIMGLQIFVPYTSRLIEGAVSEGNSLGYGISLFPIQDGNTDHVIQAFRGKQVDGFILDTRAAMLPDLPKALMTHQIPYVVVNADSKRAHPTASFVAIDDKKAFQLGTEFLIQQGHKNIGHITVTNRLNYHNRRINGYKKALLAAGLAFREELIIGDDSPQNFEIGYSCGLELINQHPEITAIFAATDNIAMGAMQAAWHLDRKIPDDISIMGFDDNYYSIMTAPPLTTIHQPVDELAIQAVQLLIKKFDDPSQKPVEVILPTYVAIRGSCAAPRQLTQALPVLEKADSSLGGAL